VRGTQVLQRHGGGDCRDGPCRLRAYLLPAASSPRADAGADGTDTADPPARPPFTGWVLLLLVQVRLVAAKRIARHRQLGVAGAAMAGLMVVVGTWTALHGVVRGVAPFGIDPRRFLIVPLFAILLFGVFVVAGVRVRRDPQSHKRWMLLATIAMLPPAIARWVLLLGFGPPVVFAVATLFAGAHRGMGLEDAPATPPGDALGWAAADRLGPAASCAGANRWLARLFQLAGGFCEVECGSKTVVVSAGPKSVGSNSINDSPLGRGKGREALGWVVEQDTGPPRRSTTA